MNDFINSYNDRKNEIDRFIEFLRFLENKQKEINNSGISNFEKFFNHNVSYTDTINILKSNIMLMIYNIIEFSIFNLIENIYDHIKSQNLNYTDLKDSLIKLWAVSVLKSVDDPNANFYTLQKKTEEIIQAIILSKKFDITAKKVFPAGNLDGSSIKKVFESHEINLPMSNYRPNLLDTVKTIRNNLAHGSISFSEAVRDKTIEDILEDWSKIKSFMKDIIDVIQEYINNQKYKRN